MSNCYVSLVGGVGNQLFQLAAGYNYSKTYRKNLVIDTSRWTGSQGRNPDEYKTSIFKNFQYSSHHPRGFTEIFEKRYNFDGLPYYAGDVRLNGYFQSQKYFQGYEEEFMSLLDLPEIKTDWIEPKNVAFHIRRGDYIQHQHIHLVCGTNYFERQFEKFHDHQINVFTDDIDQVLKEFKDYKFGIIQTHSELEDLKLLSQHDNIVCSNSSFSWWASLLGKKKEQIIVPDIWFKNFEAHDDIYRNEFTRIPV